MILDRIAIKAHAKENFKANYWISVLVFVIYAAIAGLCNSLSTIGVGAAAILIFLPVITAGTDFYALKVYRGENAELADMFCGLKNYGHVLGGMLWMELFTFLWSLLFVIPGIVKMIAYSMTPYILIDQPEIGAKDALKLSMQMTQGHKGEIFVMYLSFLGWLLLTALTGGILGIFYTTPYINVTLAGYYESLKNGNPATAEDYVHNDLNDSDQDTSLFE